MNRYKDTNSQISTSIKSIREQQLINPAAAKHNEDKLVSSLTYLVYSAVGKYRRFNNYDDLFQEGMIGLVKAVRNYNPDLTFHFTRYAMWWIKSYIWRSIKKSNAIRITGDETMIDDEAGIDNPESQMLRSEQIRQVRKIMTTLPDKHKNVIKLRYGFEGEECSFQSLGEKLNMTREGIRQLEHRIITQLKTNDILKNE